MLGEWVHQWIPDGIRGAAHHRGADDIMYEVALRIEHAIECGRPLYGLSVDYEKCFDRLPHEVMFKLVEYME
ncbi:hypothetical protein DIPPA_05528 [Diplonema papillatum]|nr:hypothetical protein DIPPA_05528 [Diplonema papillatum]